LRGRGPCGDDLNQVSVEQKRRILQDPGGNLRLIIGKAQDDEGRGFLAECEGSCELGAHDRRRIVEQHDEGALGGGPIIGAEVAVKIRARQSGRGVAALGRRSRFHPLQEFTNDHAATEAFCSRCPLTILISELRTEYLRKRSPYPLGKIDGS
jgi:hypothetical protein